MSRKTDAVVASTIGIDTGKNTLHLIGLDEQGTIILRNVAHLALCHAGNLRRSGRKQ